MLINRTESRFVKALPAFFSLTIALIALIISGCDRYAQTRPVLGEIAGRYLPQDYRENGIRKTSELILETSNKCTLVDFPVVSYPNGKSKIHYYSGSADWRLENSTGNWILLIKLAHGNEFNLRILSNKSFEEEKIPYVLCQEGEELEDDAMVFVQKK